ncbi:ribonuclease P protein component [candidate division KSB1 bacterium]|nr:ribonuclease P protein component [candidate division KSB1 bacterium]RQW00689.1 MAG: ribonuclease P protein component [candidate division KSB1 bacterium]
MILKKNADFGQLFQKGLCIKNEYFSFFFVRDNDLKIGFAVNKRCANKPIRNKLKRIARELWRTNFRHFHLPVHMVIVTSERILELDYKAREIYFKSQLQKVEQQLKATTQA